MQYVFVYGTLRAGEVNDISRAAERHAIATPECIGAAHVRGGSSTSARIRDL